MVIWIPVAAWALAVLLAVVVLGFATYEIAWKSGRLRADVASLLTLRAAVEDVRHDLDTMSRRLADLGARR
ncbi:MAG: hypothetical protein M3O28_05530 [Actinomycetota bacterium]|nr:hypothetical protein [Actinomycetota bacterium]